MSFLCVSASPLLLAAAAVFASLPASAQSGDTKSGDKPAAAQPADPAKDAQRQVDEFAEASRLVNGPAGNPECVWLGRRVVGLLWRDDMDTAFRHLDLYDRFGCPGPHIQAAFRCVVRQGNMIDPKSPPEPQRPGAFLLAEPDRGADRPPRRPPARRRGVGRGPGAGPAGTKFSGRASRRRNPEQGSALRTCRVDGRRPSSIRHDVEGIVLWPLTRYAASQQWPTQGTGRRPEVLSPVWSL